MSAVSDNNMLRLWNVESGTLSRTLEGHSDTACFFDVSPGGTRALSGSFDGAVSLWNFTTDANVAGGDMPV